LSNVLVIGSNGFIGKNVCDHFMKLGYGIHAADRSAKSSHSHFTIYQSFDVTNDDFSRILEGVDAVVYLVSTLLPQPSNLNVELDVTENLLPIIKLLEAIKNSGRKTKVIFSSSGGTVYGEHDDHIPENAPLVPKCSYGILKVTVEHYLKLYYDLHDIPSVSLRLSNPYGPGQNVNKPQGVVGIFLKKILAHEKIEIWGDGSVIRDFVHVQDVASAFAHALAADSKADIFNIGSGKGLSLKDLLSLMFELTETNSEVIYQPPRNVDVQCNILDISKANSFLNWKPNIDMREGLTNLIADKLIND